MRRIEADLETVAIMGFEYRKKKGRERAEPETRGDVANAQAAVRPPMGCNFRTTEPDWVGMLLGPMPVLGGERLGGDGCGIVLQLDQHGAVSARVAWIERERFAQTQKGSRMFAEAGKMGGARVSQARARRLEGNGLLKQADGWRQLGKLTQRRCRPL